MLFNVRYAIAPVRAFARFGTVSAAQLLVE